MVCHCIGWHDTRPVARELEFRGEFLFFRSGIQWRVRTQETADRVSLLRGSFVHHLSFSSCEIIFRTLVEENHSGKTIFGVDITRLHRESGSLRGAWT